MKEHTYHTNSKDGFFEPPTIKRTQDVPLAVDNLVCVHCGASLGAVDWTVVSSPKRKGIMAFACMVHLTPAMNLIARALGLDPVEKEVQLPDGSEN